MIFEDAVQKAQDKYFHNAKTREDAMNITMAYYKDNFNMTKLNLKGVQSELAGITNKYTGKTDDANIVKWSKEIYAFMKKKKAVINPDFDPLEYLAVNFIAGENGSGTWASIYKK